MPSGMPRRPSWPSPARRNRRCRRRRNKLRDAHAQAQSARSNPATPRMNAAGSTNWTRNAAPPSACSPLDEAVAEVNNARRPLETESRAGERLRKTEREAQARFAEQARLTRLEAELVSARSAAEQAAGNAKERSQPGTAGGGGRDSGDGAAGTDSSAGRAAGCSDPPSDDADHTGAGRFRRDDGAGERLSQGADKHQSWNAWPLKNARPRPFGGQRVVRLRSGQSCSDRQPQPMQLSSSSRRRVSRLMRSSSVWRQRADRLFHCAPSVCCPAAARPARRGSRPAVCCAARPDDGDVAQHDAGKAPLVASRCGSP